MPISISFVQRIWEYQSDEWRSLGWFLPNTIQRYTSEQHYLYTNIHQIFTRCSCIIGASAGILYRIAILPCRWLHLHGNIAIRYRTPAQRPKMVSINVHHLPPHPPKKYLITIATSFKLSQNECQFLKLVAMATSLEWQLSVTQRLDNQKVVYFSTSPE